MAKEIQLPSGAQLKIQLAPFADGKALQMALLEEAKCLRLDMTAEVDGNFYKDIFCSAFSSKKIEAAVWKCMERALYNDQKITMDTFEPEAARDDYITVVFEVAAENVRPFTKSLYASFAAITRMIQSDPA
jgi:hypothetical protein